MFRNSTMALLAALCVTASNAHAQSASTPASQAAQARSQDRPISGAQLPLFLREEWKNPTGSEHPVTAENVANPNLELKLYGPSGKQIEMGGTSASPAGARPRLPPHLWTGLCEQTCAAALRDKNNYVDLSDLGMIRWYVRVSGLHRIHPIVKLADGTWLVGDHQDGNELDLHQSEFTLAESRWIKLDIDKVVTRGRWLERSELDLTKVDEVGFTDLMPGSGHGDGGWSDVGWIEVYGKPVPRTTH